VRRAKYLIRFIIYILVYDAMMCSFPIGLYVLLRDMMCFFGRYVLLRDMMCYFLIGQ
jgi:hypothetical protein